MGQKVVLASSDTSSLKDFYSTFLPFLPSPIASFLSCLELLLCAEGWAGWWCAGGDEDGKVEIE